MSNDTALKALVIESRKRETKPKKIAINIRLEDDLYVPMLNVLCKELNAKQTDVIKLALTDLAEKIVTKEEH
ncbi:MAG: hypothetical protein KUG81_09210 [Gammaproteobacteria bacterium]|nr:hypothetical protein [Gammaproteobacteria bacterium]